MPRNLPRTLPDLAAWALTHLELWQGDPAAIGLSPQQLVQYAAQVAAFDAAQKSAEAARLASLSATRQLRDATAGLRSTSGSLLAVIKAFAEASGDEGVYPEAGVSPADAPGTLPEPAAPTNMSYAINPDGSLTIKWKARQPRGVVNVQYLVTRRLPGESSFTLIGTAGSRKSFHDATLPRGLAGADYIIQPKRGDIEGAAGNVLVVQFGSVASASLKMAA